MLLPCYGNHYTIAFAKMETIFQIFVKAVQKPKQILYNMRGSIRRNVQISRKFNKEFGVLDSAILDKMCYNG